MHDRMAWEARAEARRARERANRIAELWREARVDVAKRPFDGVLRDIERSLARRYREAENAARVAEDDVFYHRSA